MGRLKGRGKKPESDSRVNGDKTPTCPTCGNERLIKVKLHGVVDLSKAVIVGRRTAFLCYKCGD